MKFTFIALLNLIISFGSFAQNKNEDLFLAVRKGKTELVKTLLDQKADPNAVKATGPWMKINVLITAVNLEHIEIVKLLVKYKADVNWRDGFNTTALMYAATKGNKDVFLFLYENGADIRADDGHGNTVLTAAQEGKNKEIIEFVQKKLKEQK